MLQGGHGLQETPDEPGQVPPRLPAAARGCEHDVPPARRVAILVLDLGEGVIEVGDDAFPRARVGGRSKDGRVAGSARTSHSCSTGPPGMAMVSKRRSGQSGIGHWATWLVTAPKRRTNAVSGSPRISRCRSLPWGKFWDRSLACQRRCAAATDGAGAPSERAASARSLGHEWLALTDHSPRLTVARGLSAERLIAQLELVRQLNDELPPFRLLTGIEVDILEDGSLDQRDDLLGQLDVVVASVHSKLRMPAGPMTDRMVAAVRSPHVTVLGHCTGRLLTGRGRPESAFDPEAVFGACRDNGVAVEINCRPERQDPPDPLLRLAAEAGCVFAIDTDAHAPGQLDWLGSGCVRAQRFGIPPERVINTRSAEEMASRAGR